MLRKKSIRYFDNSGPNIAAINPPANTYESALLLKLSGTLSAAAYL